MFERSVKAGWLNESEHRARCVTQDPRWRLQGTPAWAYLRDGTVVVAWQTNKAHLCAFLCVLAAAIRHVLH